MSFRRADLPREQALPRARRDLHAHRLRRTPQRAAVYDMLGEADGFRSAREIHGMLSVRGDPIGLTTVYRTLQAFTDTGEVDSIQIGPETYYRRCSRGRHHHLVCRWCGTAIEIEAPAIDEWAEAVAARYGFHEPRHTLEIFGRCPRCPVDTFDPREPR